MKRTAANLQNDGYHNTGFKKNGKEIWQRGLEYILFDRRNGLTNKVKG